MAYALPFTAARRAGAGARPAACLAHTPALEGKKTRVVAALPRSAQVRNRRPSREAARATGAQADDGVRTRDPQLGKLMLYQLSYVRALDILAPALQIPNRRKCRVLSRARVIYEKGSGNRRRAGGMRPRLRGPVSSVAVAVHEKRAGAPEDAASLGTTGSSELWPGMHRPQTCAEPGRLAALRGPTVPRRPGSRCRQACHAGFEKSIGIRRIATPVAQPALRVCDDDRRPQVDVLEQPLGVRDVHPDAAV